MKKQAEPTTDDEIAFLAYLQDEAGLQLALKEHRQMMVKALTRKADKSSPRRLSKSSKPHAASISQRAIAQRHVAASQNKQPRLQPSAYNLTEDYQVSRTKANKSPTPKQEKSLTRVLEEPWGTREDWMRDSGANWSTAKKDKLT